MSMKWKQGDWAIHLNDKGDKAGNGWCLRHMPCGGHTVQYDEGDRGSCSCSKGECRNCNVKVPDEVKGFFELVKWKR